MTEAFKHGMEIGWGFIGFICAISSFMIPIIAMGYCVGKLVRFWDETRKPFNNYPTKEN